MGRSGLLTEEIVYINLYRGDIFLVDIYRKIIEEGEKLSNIIRDIELLIKAGIRVVITYSGQACRPEAWQSLEPITIHEKLKRPGVPVVFLGETNSSENDQAIIKLAKEVGAAKVIFVTSHGGVYLPGNKLIGEMDFIEARSLMEDQDKSVTLNMRDRIWAALMVCEAGIARAHIIGAGPGSLLKEIMTSEGTGTMIYREKYKEVRPANPDDTIGIFETIRSSIWSSTNLSLKVVSQNIANFLVFTVDDRICGCVMIKANSEAGTGEVMYLSVLPAFGNDFSLVRRLLEAAIEKMPSGTKRIILDPNRNIRWIGLHPWFDELGFSGSDLNTKWVKEVDQ